MAQYVLFTKAFWKDMSERVVSTAAQAVAATIGVDQTMDWLGKPDAFHLEPKAIGLAAGFGALAALVKGLAKLGLTAPVSTVYVPRDPTDDEIREFIARKSGGDVE